ncbi:MAG: aconitase family protein [Bacilli bacterium]
MGQTLFEKVWRKHAVRELPDGSTQLLVGTHLLHEVTSPQAFGMLRALKLGVKYPSRTYATVDHIIPTDDHPNRIKAQRLMKCLRKYAELQRKRR